MPTLDPTLDTSDWHSNIRSCIDQQTDSENKTKLFSALDILIKQEIVNKNNWQMFTDLISKTSPDERQQHEMQQIVKTLQRLALICHFTGMPSLPSTLLTAKKNLSNGVVSNGVEGDVLEKLSTVLSTVDVLNKLSTVIDRNYDALQQSNSILVWLAQGSPFLAKWIGLFETGWERVFGRPFFHIAHKAPLGVLLNVLPEFNIELREAGVNFIGSCSDKELSNFTQTLTALQQSKLLNENNFKAILKFETKMMNNNIYHNTIEDLSAAISSLKKNKCLNEETLASVLQCPNSVKESALIIKCLTKAGMQQPQYIATLYKNSVVAEKLYTVLKTMNMEDKVSFFDQFVSKSTLKKFFQCLEKGTTDNQLKYLVNFNQIVSVLRKGGSLGHDHSELTSAVVQLLDNSEVLLDSNVTAKLLKISSPCQNNNGGNLTKRLWHDLLTICQQHYQNKNQAVELITKKLDIIDSCPPRLRLRLRGDGDAHNLYLRGPVFNALTRLPAGCLTSDLWSALIQIEDTGHRDTCTEWGYRGSISGAPSVYDTTVQDMLKKLCHVQAAHEQAAHELSDIRESSDSLVLQSLCDLPGAFVGHCDSLSLLGNKQKGSSRFFTPTPNKSSGGKATTAATNSVETTAAAAYGKSVWKASLG